MPDKREIETIKTMMKSKNIDDRVFVASYLKELGCIGKRVYLLTKNEELKKQLYKLKEIIESI